MKSATGTVAIFFVLIECRASFTDPRVSALNERNRYPNFL